MQERSFATFPSPDRGRGVRGEGAKAGGCPDLAAFSNVVALNPGPSPAAGRRGRNTDTPHNEGDAA